MTRKLCCTLFWTPRPGGMQWCHWQYHKHCMMLSLAPNFNCLDLRMQRCCWWRFWQNVILVLIMPINQKRHVALHFDCLYLRNTIMPFMMLLTSCYTDSDPKWHHVTPIPVASCNANASGNCITWPKSLVTSNFDCLDPRNVMLPQTMLTASCDAITSVSGIIWSQKLCCT